MAKSKQRTKIAQGELDFSVAAVSLEVEQLAALASPLLEPDSVRVAKEAATNLRTFAASKRAGNWPWSVGERNPIRTRLTRAYEPGKRRGPIDVWGELSFTWTIVLVHPSPGATFSLSGNASSKICIKMQDSNHSTALVGQWQLEVGDAQSPGTHFHVGLCRGDKELPFPHWFTVPRLPSVLVMPVDALDFLLGELFQTDWRARVSQENDRTRALFASQRDRLSRLLAWKLNEVTKSGGSPWSWLKHRHPDAELFTRER